MCCFSLIASWLVLAGYCTQTPVELHVTGMTCQACVKRVGGALQAVPGVQSADVTLDTGVVLVKCTGSENGVSSTLRSLLTAAVEDVGFGVGTLE